MRLIRPLISGTRQRGVLGAAALLLTASQAIAQTPAQAPCAQEQLRPLGISLVPSDGPQPVQAVCSQGSLERIALSAAIGAVGEVDFDLRQSAFAESIYHLELRGQDRAPVDWIEAAPSAGELNDAETARIRLTLTPPPELVSTIQTVVLHMKVHDGQQSWSRDLELSITVSEEQPLFRDRFDIAPVIGQFSQRASQPSRLHLTSATVPTGD
ncbi:hypothetical protein AY599_23540 [Leptolyngbya valderiana BDU 20041]|nr:hypothetical protein AY599_23540 [Leptolyngbya valderiana BDU 20041]